MKIIIGIMGGAVPVPMEQNGLFCSKKDPSPDPPREAGFCG